MDVPQKKKKKELPCDLANPFLRTYPKDVKIGYQRYLHSYSHCSINAIAKILKIYILLTAKHCSVDE